MGFPEKHSGFLHWATGCQYPVDIPELYRVEMECCVAPKMGMSHNGNWLFVHVGVNLSQATEAFYFQRHTNDFRVIQAILAAAMANGQVRIPVLVL